LVTVSPAMLLNFSFATVESLRLSAFRFSRKYAPPIIRKKPTTENTTAHTSAAVDKPDDEDEGVLVKCALLAVLAADGKVMESPPAKVTAA